MDWHDSLSFWRNRLPDCFGIKALGFWIAIHQYGSSTRDPDGLGCSEEGIGVRDHFVAFAQAQRHESQPERIRAIADANCILSACVCGQFILESFQRGALHILTAL